MHARVIVLAGPSGSGKSHLAAQTGLPTLALDDFYRNAEDPGMPRIATGANAGLVDWDHPGSWNGGAALTAIQNLCLHSSIEVPRYEFAQDRATGRHLVERADSRLFIAEGIFAAEVVRPCLALGVLAAAYCVNQSALLTYGRRLSRDLMESRKPLRVATRRGITLLRDHSAFVRHAVAAGCQLATPPEILANIAHEAGQP
jgi:uridine kinase